MAAPNQSSPAMVYLSGDDVQIGDRVTHHGIPAIVESVHSIGDIRLGVDDEDLPAFMIVCDECGRVLVTTGSEDWEDVSFVRRSP